jgi:hypothetical protein
MKDILQMLDDAIPFLRNHPVLSVRLFLIGLALISIYGAKGLRRRICQPLASKLVEQDFRTSRWLYVYKNSMILNDWKHYTSETTGNANCGDDVIWTLVDWPNLKPKDSFRVSGAVGMLSGISDSEAKLYARWNIVHDPDSSIGPVPALGMRSKLGRAAAKILRWIASF